MLVLIAMFIKNLGFLTIYAIRNIIDKCDDAHMRPITAKQISRLEMEAFNCIQAYLLDPQDDSVDQFGNTRTH